MFNPYQVAAVSLPTLLKTVRHCTAVPLPIHWSVLRGLCWPHKPIIQRFQGSRPLRDIKWCGRIAAGKIACNSTGQEEEELRLTLNLPFHLCRLPARKEQQG